MGAVLTQNTAWKNVAAAMENLKEMGLVSVTSLHQISDDELAEHPRPAGYFRLKARRLKNLVNFVVRNYDGNL